jgi:hypothetical protein
MSRPHLSEFEVEGSNPLVCSKISLEIQADGTSGGGAMAIEKG